MNLFICTHYGDAHALAVEHVLKRLGHNVFRWVTESSTGEQSHSVTYKNGEADYKLQYLDETVQLSSIDVVWWRRQNEITLPTNVNAGDGQFALREWGSVYDALPELFGANTRWINPNAGRAASDRKLLQLREAQRVGLHIPQTLVSNNPVDIRDFVDKQVHGAVHKMFNSAYWRNDDFVVRSRTRA